MTFFFGLLLAAANMVPLDSATVLDRYQSQLAHVKDPQTLVFTYAVSQAGPQDIDQVHRIYRSGDLVRDETLVVNGASLRSTRVAKYRNRYALHSLAPSPADYVFFFLRAARAGAHFDYVFRAVPLQPLRAFTVESITIDGRTFLPREIRFRSTGIGASAAGVLSFTRFGKYWVAASAAVRGRIGRAVARERITFSGYQFPRRLPRSAFANPKQLPPAILPAY